MSSKPDKKLFTPGPLLTSRTVKEAMLRDLGSRDVEFVRAVREIRQDLLKVAGVSEEDWFAIPMQGSGTFAVESVFQTAVPRNGGRVLILTNGAYGKRIMKICDLIGIAYDFTMTPENLPVPLDVVRDKLENIRGHNSFYNLVAIVHCETSSGVINDVESVAKLVRDIDPRSNIFVDAMSSFGAIALNLDNIDFLVSSANKCLEGIPGFAYALCRKERLNPCKGNSRSLSLDLYDQVDILDKTGQFRFTPPTHSILGFQRALKEYWEEGGLDGRYKRYLENTTVLKSEMRKMGFLQLVPDEFAGPVITTYLLPNDPNFCFETLYKKLSEKDQVIYPGKITDAATFRIGNIGQIFPSDVKYLIKCFVEVLTEMGVSLPVKY